MKLPEGVLWGHTLIGSFGMAGHYLYLASILGGGALIVAGWARIYQDYWSKDDSGLNRIFDKTHGCEHQGTEAIAPDQRTQGRRLPRYQRPRMNKAAPPMNPVEKNKI